MLEEVCVSIFENLYPYIVNVYLNDCLIFEVSVNNKKDYVVSWYQSPSQMSDEFEVFLAI